MPSPSTPKPNDSLFVQALINALPDLGNAPEGRWPQAGVIHLDARHYDFTTPIDLPPGVTVRGHGTQTTAHIAQGPMFRHWRKPGGNDVAAWSSVEDLCINVDKGDGIGILAPAEAKSIAVRGVTFNVPNGIAINYRNSSGKWTYNARIEDCRFRDVWQCAEMLGEHFMLTGNELSGDRPRTYTKLPDADFNFEGGWANWFAGNYISAKRGNPLLRGKDTRITAQGNAIEPSAANPVGTPFIVLDGTDLMIDQTDSWPHAPGIMRNKSELHAQKIHSAPVAAGWLSDGTCKIFVNGKDVVTGAAW